MKPTQILASKPPRKVEEGGLLEEPWHGVATVGYGYLAAASASIGPSILDDQRPSISFRRFSIDATQPPIIDEEDAIIDEEDEEQ